MIPVIIFTIYTLITNHVFIAHDQDWPYFCNGSSQRNIWHPIFIHVFASYYDKRGTTITQITLVFTPDPSFKIESSGVIIGMESMKNCPDAENWRHVMMTLASDWHFPVLQL